MDGGQGEQSSVLQRLQLSRVQDGHHAPGQLYHALALKIAQHPGNHLPVGAQVVGDVLVGELQLTGPSMEASSSRKAARRLSRLFHMTCSISHMTSENRPAINSPV